MFDRHSIRAKLPEIVIEAASIVLAVLLALAVNAWWEARKTEKLVATATDSIEGELWRNRRVLEANLPNHRRLLDTLGQQAHETVKPSEPDEIPESLYFNPIFFRSSAWQAAVTTGAIASMPYDRVSSFSEIYNFQEALAATTQAVMAASFQGAFNAGDPARTESAAQFAAVAQAIGVLVLMEEQLLGIYQGFLDGDGTYASLLEILRQGSAPGSSAPPATGAPK